MLPWNTCGDTQGLVKTRLQPSSIQCNFMSQLTLGFGEGAMCCGGQESIDGGVKRLPVRVVALPLSRAVLSLPTSMCPLAKLSDFMCKGAHVANRVGASGCPLTPP